MTLDFADHFWGPKNNGFEVLYRNMKYGAPCSKELSDFFKERAALEEVHSKALTRLSNVASTRSPQGTFAPVWQILKNSSEKLSGIHVQMMQKIQEIVKELAKYADDLQKKYKTVKDEEAGTLEVVQLIQVTTLSAQKAKEVYFQRASELEKLQKENASQKDIEKAEAKTKKAYEDYKIWVEKYSVCRDDFERKMMLACKHFQDVEAAHLFQMKEFLDSYATVMETNHELIGQVHQDFRRQCSEMTVDSLLDQFVTAKGTGSEKPGLLEMEEMGSCDRVSAGSGGSEDKSCNGERGSEKKREGFLRSRRDKKKEKKVKKKEGSLSGKEDKSDGDEKEESHPSSNTPTAEIDDEGYTVRPKISFENEKNRYGSTSDSDSDDEREKRLHVEIKPLNNGNAPLSASVDELRSTVENMTLSPIGISMRKLLHDADNPMKRSQSVSQQIGSSSPPSRHPYAPLSPPMAPPNPRSSPKSVTNDTSSRYADLGDLFAEVGDIQPSLPPKLGAIRNTPTPTGGSVAIPRPPSRPRPEGLTQRNISSPSPAISRTESIGSLDTRSIGSHMTGSRGPSPLTIGMADSIPLAVAFHEIVHACFKGNDETQCQVKMTGDMMVSFPAGIIQVFANNPQPSQLAFQIRTTQRLDNLVSNQELVNVQRDERDITFEFNMSALVILLKKHAEQNPNASYFNVDILKYHILPKPGAGSCPLHLVAFWKCEASQTDLRIDYKYNSHAMTSFQPVVPVSTNTRTDLPPLLQVCVAAPVDGGVKSMQSKPTGQWFPNTSRACWKLPSLSLTTENQGVGSLRARFDITNGPSSSGTIAAQFSCENSTLSGCEFKLLSSSYRVSLIKKRFVSGKYTCDAEDSSSRYAVPSDHVTHV